MENNKLIKIDNSVIEKMSVETQKILMEDLQSSIEGISFKPPRYTIEHKALHFRMTADDSLKKTIEGVIVAKQKIRGIWKENDKTPICSSLDGVKGVETGVENIRQCFDCRYNQWGSGKDGTHKGKACKEMRRILVVESSKDLFPVSLTIPPTSLNIFDGFISALIHKKIPLLATNVIFSLERASGGGFDYAKLKMELGAPLTEEQIIKVAGIKKSFEDKFKTISVEAEEYDKVAKEDEFFANDVNDLK